MNRFRFIGVFLFFLSSLSIFSQNTYERAERLFQAGEYSLALDVFDSFLRANPGSDQIGDAQFRRGQILFHLGRYREAYELFQRIETRFANTRFYAELPFWKGITVYHLKDYTTAIQFLSEYLKGTPQKEGKQKALLYLAFSEKRLGNLSKAKELCQRLFTPEYLQNPEEEALILFASIAKQLGSLDELIALHTRVSVEHLEEPARSRFLILVGEAFYRQFLYGRAAETFSAVSPGATQEKIFALQRSLQSFAFLKQTNSILRVMEEAKQLENLASQAEVWQLGIRILFGMGEYEKVIHYAANLQARGYKLDLLIQGILVESHRLLGNPLRALEVIRGDTTGEELLLLRGQLQLQVGSSLEAEQTLKKWIAAFPQSPHRIKGKHLLAWALFQQGKLQEALEFTILDPPYAVEDAIPLLRLRAVLFGKLGMAQEALTAWDIYLIYRKEDIEAAVERLRVLLTLNRSEQVLKEIEGLKDRNVPPRIRSAVQLLTGVALVKEGRFSEAVKSLEALTLQPLVEESMKELQQYARFYLGWALNRIGDYERSVSLYRALVLDPTLPRELRLRSIYYGAWSAYTLNRFDLAENLLSVFPTDERTIIRERIRFLRGKVLSQLGRKREAQEQFHLIFTQDPEGVLADDALFELAGIFVEHGQVPEAVRAYMDIFTRYPESPFRDSALYKAGETFFAVNQYQEARAAFLQYRTLLPRGNFLDQSLFWEGIASYRVGEPYAALLVWERLIGEHPNSPLRSEALNQAAAVLSELGDYRTALSYLRQLSREYPQEGNTDAVRRRIRELDLLVAGSTEREASLKVRLEEARGTATLEGRRIALELIRLYLYERGGHTAEREALRWIDEIINRGARDGREWAEAQYLRGEWLRRRGDLLNAAIYFNQAASARGADADLSARALFQAVRMLALAGRKQEALQFYQVLQRNFPNSPWVPEGRKVIDSHETNP